MARGPRRGRLTCGQQARSDGGAGDGGHDGEGEWGILRVLVAPTDALSLCAWNVEELPTTTTTTTATTGARGRSGSSSAGGRLVLAPPSRRPVWRPLSLFRARRLRLTPMAEPAGGRVWSCNVTHAYKGSRHPAVAPLCTGVAAGGGRAAVAAAEGTASAGSGAGGAAAADADGGGAAAAVGAPEEVAVGAMSGWSVGRGAGSLWATAAPSTTAFSTAASTTAFPAGGGLVGGETAPKTPPPLARPVLPPEGS